MDEKWGDPAVWQAMRGAVDGLYDRLLPDRDRSRAGRRRQRSQRVDENQRIYLYLFVKTFILSGVITVLCLLLAFPVAHLLATLPMAKANLLMILVLLPFWTSLLVRTTSWIVLLQGQGVVNDLLVASG